MTFYATSISAYVNEPPPGHSKQTTSAIRNSKQVIAGFYKVLYIKKTKIKIKLKLSKRFLLGMEFLYLGNLGFFLYISPSSSTSPPLSAGLESASSTVVFLILLLLTVVIERGGGWHASQAYTVLQCTIARKHALTCIKNKPRRWHHTMPVQFGFILDRIASIPWKIQNRLAKSSSTGIILQHFNKNIDPAQMVPITEIVISSFNRLSFNTSALWSRL